MEARQGNLPDGAADTEAGKDSARRQFRLFDGSEDVAQSAETGDFCGSAHRTSGPVYASAVDWSAVAAGEEKAVEIPESERQRYAESTTLRRLYEDPQYGMEAARLQRVSDGTLARNTRAKDVQALNRWERYSPRPGNWPGNVPWEGRPLAWITDQHCTDTVAAMRRELSSETCRSTWRHLRGILNHAVRVRALESTPEPEWSRAEDRQAKELYTDGQLAAIYESLAAQADLQVAFVVSVNAGLRSVDLFSLRWSNVLLRRERPALEFTSRKTGRRQLVPLGPVTVAQLDRWRRATGVLLDDCMVWPKLTDPDAADPERSRAARRRNARLKAALATLGIEHAKPWQVGRLTCNERLERHRPGSGQFVLGHAATLNSVSYREPSGLIYEAVSTLPQPDCFRL
jgi:integrase